MLIEVSESSQASDARRKVLACAEDLELNEMRRGALAVAVSEMATNLVKHAKRGHIVVQQFQRGVHPGLRVISVDKGPGIQDITRALSDGHSTAGSMGSGLGAIKRLSDAFEIYSVPGAGTVICAEFWDGTSNQSIRSLASLQAPIDVGIISEPITGEEVCGDGWGVRSSSDSILLMVVDGLGHGVLAAEAAREAERILSESRKHDPHEILLDTHAALKKTRGAAIGLAKIDLQRRVISFVGVGNVSASVVSQNSSRGFASHNGILGQQMQKVQEFMLPWNHDNILIMHSDGVATRWDLERYPGLKAKRASLIASVLHRDFSRGRDDATVLAAKAAPTN